MKSSLSFSVSKKKTPFQRHKELEEERKKKADEEAAKLYEEFVESFKGDEDSSGPKAFVRGGTYQPGQRSTTDGNAAAPNRKSGGKYVPSFLPPSFAEAAKEKRECEDDESVFALPSARKDKGQGRAIDNLLETIKKEQEAREERQRARREGRGSLFDLPPSADEVGSFDDGDPFTTNLYVGNLAPNVDEEVLKKEFGRFGPIASVKVMWPRDDDQKRRGRNCGFVAFMRRDDAQQALDKLNGIMLYDYEMKIGWGKAVPIPPVPIYPAPANPHLYTGKGAGVPPPGAASRAPWAPSHSEEPGKHAGAGPDIEVQPPEDGRIRYIIDTLATYVMKDGCAFEQIIMETEQKNPEYAFLFDLASPEHAYYRWRLYSLAENDSLKVWRIEPFVMVEGGQRWIPPPMTMSDSRVMTAAQKGGDGKERERQLSDLERDRFEDMLRQISVERADICVAMVFALDNADAAGEVVEVLSDSLTLPETPVPLKIARLFLVSDILHNSTAPVRNASRYRTKLEAVLPEIFESLQDAYRSVDSRMTQEALRRHVLRVLRVWRERYLFSDDYLNGLQATFLRPLHAAGRAEEAALVAQELTELGDEEVERRCRMNGLSIKGGRDTQLLRLQALDVYLNGDKVTGDLPLRPFSRSLLTPPSSTPLRVLPEDGQPGLFEDPLLPGSGVATPVMDDLHPALAGASGMDTTAASTAPLAAAALEATAAPRAAPVPLSRWTTVDEDEEKQHMPGVPISKWLLQEQEAQREKEYQEQLQLLEQQRAAMAAAAAAAAASSEDIFSDEEEDARQAGVAPGAMPGAELGWDNTKAEAMGAGGAHVIDKDEEERRAKLRKVEVEVMMFREELEEKGGISKEQIDEKVATKRKALMTELEGSSTGRAAGRSSRTSRERERDGRERDRDGGGQAESRRKETDNRDNKDKSRDKDRDKGRSRDKDRDKEREKDKDREREREKDKERERDRDRDKKGRERERERDRDKERDKDRDIHRRERSRERDSSRKRGRSSPHTENPALSSPRRERSRSRSPKRNKSGRDRRSRSRSRSPSRHDRRDKDRSKSSRR